jgi:hypothetical protein
MTPDMLAYLYLDGDLVNPFRHGLASDVPAGDEAEKVLARMPELWAAFTEEERALVLAEVARRDVAAWVRAGSSFRLPTARRVRYRWSGK